MNFSKSKDQIVESIRKAFRGVKLGDGIGLCEARALDDFCSGVARAKEREKDERDDWSSFPPAVLQKFHSSLAFFDADGMRFHLPAYIIGSLRGSVDDPVFYLTHLDDYAKSRLGALDNAQRQAVADYLEWCLRDEDFHFEHPIIMRALNEYWKEGAKKKR